MQCDWCVCRAMLRSKGATGAGAVRQIDRTVAGMSAKYRAAIASMRRGAMLPIDEKTI